MRFNEINIVDIQPRIGQCLLHNLLLRRTKRHSQAGTATVVIRGRASHNRQDVVAVALRILEAFQYHQPSAIAPYRAVCVISKRLTMPISGRHLESAEFHKSAR